MNGFVWYSFGGDVSGRKLAEALGYASGKKTPSFKSHSILLGWGCRPGERYDRKNLLPLISTRALRVINHPENIAASRDKIALLKALTAADVPAPGYVTSNVKGPERLLEAVKAGLDVGKVLFPLIGYNSFHKGTPFFCHTMEDVQAAVAAMVRDARQTYYFRSFCPGTEYRIHVLRDEALWAQVKILDEDPLTACQADLMDKFRKRAEKEKIEIPLNSDQLKWAVSSLASEMLASGNHMQRSVKRGWKYQDLPVMEVPEQVLAVALDGLDAAGLDLGAVSVIFSEGVGRVTNITTAPALSEEQMAVYVAAIQNFAGAKQDSKTGKPTPTARKRAESAGTELMARLRQKLSGGVSQKAAEEALKALGD